MKSMVVPGRGETVSKDFITVVVHPSVSSSPSIPLDLSLLRISWSVRFSQLYTFLLVSVTHGLEDDFVISLFRNDDLPELALPTT
jgi:hypothetical protein